MGNYSKYEDKVCDITIINHTSIEDGKKYDNGVAAGFRLIGNGYKNTWKHSVSGTVNYSGTINNPAGDGVSIHSWHQDKSPKGIIKATIKNVGYFGAKDKAGVNIFNGAGASFPCGNVSIDVDVFDTREKSNTYTAVYFQNSNMPLRNIDVLIGGDYNNYFGKSIVQIGQNINHANIKFKDKPEYTVATNLGKLSTPHTSGGIAKFVNGGVFNLPILGNVIGQEFTIINSSQDPVYIKPYSEDKILTVKNYQGINLVLKKNKDFIVLMATKGGWLKAGGNVD